MASFFSWNSGSPEQRSQFGFLRAVLYEVLESQKGLVPLIFPSRWTPMYSQLLQSSNHRASHPWKMAELIQGLKTLVKEDLIKRKVFMLVDGLDEYEGDHGEMAESIRMLANSSNVKICVSSRPYLVFDDAFQGCPGCA